MTTWFDEVDDDDYVDAYAVMGIIIIQSTFRRHRNDNIMTTLTTTTTTTWGRSRWDDNPAVAVQLTTMSTTTFMTTTTTFSWTSSSCWSSMRTMSWMMTSTTMTTLGCRHRRRGRRRINDNVDDVTTMCCRDGVTTTVSWRPRQRLYNDVDDDVVVDAAIAASTSSYTVHNYRVTMTSATRIIMSRQRWRRRVKDVVVMMLSCATSSTWWQWCAWQRPHQRCQRHGRNVVVDPMLVRVPMNGNHVLGSGAHCSGHSPVSRDRQQQWPGHQTMTTAWSWVTDDAVDGRAIDVCVVRRPGHCLWPGCRMTMTDDTDDDVDGQAIVIIRVRHRRLTLLSDDDRRHGHGQRQRWTISPDDDDNGPPPVDIVVVVIAQQPGR